MYVDMNKRGDSVNHHHENDGYYFDLFVRLSLQQCNKNEYGETEKIEQHNLATKKLRCLQAVMKSKQLTDVLSRLLSHGDDRVRINAASFCIELCVFTSRAENVLKDIIKNNDDPTMRFSAKMLLQTKR